MKQLPSRLAHAADDYQRLGIAKRVAPWEDGLRTDGSRGTFEWWYFDAHLDDGSTLVIVFYAKSIYEANKRGFHPYATIQYERPGGAYLEKECHADLSRFFASKDGCDVRIGPCTFSCDLHTCRIHCEMDAVHVDVTLTGTVPAWRPYASHTMFGENDEYYFAWLPSIPQGRVSGTIDIAGIKTRLSGIGYHDHNWGNAPMQDVLHHWYWGRAKVGDYTVISSYIYAAERYGYNEIPVFLLAKGDEILAENSLRCVSFEAEGRFIEPNTGKPNYKKQVFTYRDGKAGCAWRVTYSFERDVDQWRMVDKLPKVKGVLARLAGFDGAYLRVGGTVVLENLMTGERFEEPALWETMYFGKNLESY